METFPHDSTIRTSHREHERNKSGETNSSSPTSPPYNAEHGPLIDRTDTADMRTKGSNMGLMWPRIRHYLRKPFAEFMGTFILIMFGDGSVAQVVLSSDKYGEYQSISWGWVSVLFIPLLASLLTCAGPRRHARCIRKWHQWSTHQSGSDVRELCLSKVSVGTTFITVGS